MKIDKDKLYSTIQREIESPRGRFIRDGEELPKTPHVKHFKDSPYVRVYEDADEIKVYTKMFGKYFVCYIDKEDIACDNTIAANVELGSKIDVSEIKSVIVSNLGYLKITFCDDSELEF